MVNHSLLDPINN